MLAETLNLNFANSETILNFCTNSNYIKITVALCFLYYFKAFVKSSNFAADM